MLRIIELAGGDAAGFATMFLAALGCDVTVVDTPEDSPDGNPTPNSEASRDYLRRRKRSVALDWRSPPGRDRLRDLVRHADAVVEDLGPGVLAEQGLSFETLREVNPRVVLTSISPFGATGPRAEWKGTELVVQAMGGVVAASGHDEGPPLRLAGAQAAHVGGVLAAIETLAAALGVRHGSAEAVHLDISCQEALSTHWTREIGRYVYTGEETPRASRRLGLQGFPHTAEAADGWLFLLALRADWDALAELLELEEFIGPEWDDPQTRVDRWAEIEPHFEASLRRRGRYEWFSRAAQRGHTFAPVDDPLTILASPQLEARGYFSTVKVGDRTVPVPDLPFKAASEPIGSGGPPDRDRFSRDKEG